MTHNDLKTLVQSIADKWKYKLEELEGEKLRLDVAIKMKDDTWRYQFVYLWIKVQGDHSYVYMNSRVGQYDRRVDLYKLLVESGYGRYCAVTILPDKLDGRDVESICVSACPHAKVVNEELLDQIIYDVAFNADYLEKMLFGEDKH